MTDAFPGLQPAGPVAPLNAPSDSADSFNPLQILRRIWARRLLLLFVAGTVFATQAMAARNDVAAQHATTKAHTSATDCVRAPNVGAFASDPYTVPPCMPNTATDTF